MCNRRKERKRMRKLHLLVALGLICLGVAAGAAPSARTLTVKISSGLGTKILVSSSGMTLYHYTHEKNGSIECTGACTKLWLPLLAGGALPVAGPGLAAGKLGTIKRPDGGVQVTYNGLALYRYSADRTAHQTNGQGVGGAWFAVTPAGTITKAEATSAASPASTNSSVSSSTPSSGGNTSGGTAGAGGAGNGAPVCPPGGNDYNPNEPCYAY
jgi:predicted lipoprotein with Yx(FWY)xxD motif